MLYSSTASAKPRLMDLRRFSICHLAPFPQLIRPLETRWAIFFWQNLFSLIGRQARSVMPLMQDQWKWVLWESNDSWTPKGTASFFPEEHQFSSADRCWAELPPQRYSVTITSTFYHDDATHGEKISERRWAQKVKSFDDFCNWWLYTLHLVLLYCCCWLL